MSASDHVAVFWDYENRSPPSSMLGHDVVQSICEIAHRFGSVSQFKAYLDLSEQNSPKSMNFRAELQLSGVTLVHCPHNGRKDVVDKMMIVDMFTYAIDTPAPSTLVLITSDRDFAYAMSVLKFRKYRVVLVAPDTAGATLKSQASDFFDWETDVLCKATAKIRLDATELSPPLLPVSPDPREVHRRTTSASGVLTTTDTGTATGVDSKVPTASTKGTPRIVTEADLDAQSVLDTVQKVTSPTPAVFGRRTTSPAKVDPILETGARGAKSNPSSSLSHVLAGGYWDGFYPPDERAFPPKILPSSTKSFSPSHLNSHSESLESSGKGVTSTGVLRLSNGSDSSDSDVPGRTTSGHPFNFRYLIDILEQYKRGGVTHPLRSAVGNALLQRDRDLYNRSGGPVSFAHYTTEAECIGLVHLGGYGGYCWISLSEPDPSRDQDPESY